MRIDFEAPVLRDVPKRSATFVGRRGVGKLRSLLGVAFAQAPIGMAIADGSGRIEIANAALSRITGHPATELAGWTIEDLVPDDSLGREDRQRLISGEVASYEGSVELRHADGSPVWVALTATRDDTAHPVTLIYQLQDISERRALEARLRYLVDYDLLTGLFNRSRFDEELARQVQRHRRTGEGGAVLMIDLDGFKAINDQFGQAAGNALLSGLGAAFRARARTTDVVARLHGDEFAVLLPAADRATAEIVAAALVALVRGYASGIGCERAQVTASVGVALFGALTESEVLALANTAMFAAKEAGRDRHVVLEASDPLPERSGRADEAGRLRRAIADGRFVLHCQRVWHLSETTDETYELLIRMRSETDDSLIAPNAFLYAAERFGLISAIDCWVVTQAVRLIAEHDLQGRRLVLFVNLSGLSVADPAVAAHIEAMLEASGIDPSCLVFEVTETAAIANIEAAVAFSEGLRRRGCRFALDDFGAGFASFYYLKRLPFDFLKIDGDFINGLPNSPVDRLVVDAIVTIARGMGKETIAEYVTDAETSALLLAAGVDYAQGFHIGRPGPIEGVLASEYGP
jgi:diguanylate cyclase (GGDEF)-like protein/PAS domain S-box-containing protein